MPGVLYRENEREHGPTGRSFRKGLYFLHTQMHTTPTTTPKKLYFEAPYKI